MATQISVPIDTKGEFSGTHFVGVFKVKTTTSFRDALREDEVRRTLLGAAPDAAGDYQASVAAALAYLAVRCIDVPDWWKSANNGVDLEDPNVLVEINNKIREAIDSERAAISKSAEQAQEALKAKVDPAG